MTKFKCPIKCQMSNDKCQMNYKCLIPNDRVRFSRYLTFGIWNLTF